jgi:NADH:ubiquinone oxidoreductase subunit 6 (subunit J)
MKKINNFIDKAPLWQIYVVSYFFSAIMVFVMCQMMGLLLDPKKLDTLVSLKIGATSGLLFGLMLTLIISLMKKSQQFWDFAKEVDSKIKEAKPGAEIIAVYENEFSQLRKMSAGGPQNQELIRLYTIMTTKIEYV